MEELRIENYEKRSSGTDEHIAEESKSIIESQVHIEWIKAKLEDLDIGQKEILTEVKKIKETDIAAVKLALEIKLEEANKHISKLDKFTAMYGLIIGGMLAYLFGLHSLVHIPIP